jgi:hypothetical protein
MSRVMTQMLEQTDIFARAGGKDIGLRRLAVELRQVIGAKTLLSDRLGLNPMARTQLKAGAGSEVDLPALFVQFNQVNELAAAPEPPSEGLSLPVAVLPDPEPERPTAADSVPRTGKPRAAKGRFCRRGKDGKFSSADAAEPAIVIDDGDDHRD